MAGAAQTFIEQFVGGQFAVRERPVTLAVAAVEALRNDPERVGWLLVNTGATTAQVAFNVAPSAVSSILVASLGGTLSVNLREDFVLPTWALHANVAAGASTLFIVEIVRVSEAAPGV